MVSERLEVRLDPELRRRLVEFAAAHSVSMSQAVREMIDRGLEDADVARRVRLAEEIGRMEIGENPDPEILSRELDSVHDIPDPYSDVRYQEPLRSN